MAAGAGAAARMLAEVPVPSLLEAAAGAVAAGAGSRSDAPPMAVRASEVSQPRQRLLVLSMSDPEIAAAHLQP